LRAAATLWRKVYDFIILVSSDLLVCCEGQFSANTVEKVLSLE